MSFSINTSLVSKNIHNQQNKIGSNALNTYMIIGFVLVLFGLIGFFYLASGRTTNKDEKNNC